MIILYWFFGLLFLLIEDERDVFFLFNIIGELYVIMGIEKDKIKMMVY